MKNLILFALTIMSFQIVEAKYVKFAVDMTGQVVSPNGVHLSGDFQTLAGYSGGNWQSGTTPMLKEGATDIYSVIVKIPAFAKYEYKFVNGDLFYESEFVPEPSRVGYDFNDNRWIYVDSLGNDTMNIGAIMFGGNAPQGKKLLRVKVNLKQAGGISAKGVHVAGDFQGWDPAITRLYSFVNNLFEIIVYTDSTTNYEYKFYNGNNTTNTEVVPATCAKNGNRAIKVITDTVLQEICFSGCSICSTTGFQTMNETNNVISIEPNPFTNHTLIKLAPNEVFEISVYDVNGKCIQNPGPKTGDFNLERGAAPNGLYFIKATNQSGVTHYTKIVIN